jgi:hypothetical protein
MADDSSISKIENQVVNICQGYQVARFFLSTVFHCLVKLKNKGSCELFYRLFSQRLAIIFVVFQNFSYPIPIPIVP